jgi:hypothetical protein
MLTLELPGFGEVVEELRDGGDLIGFFRHAPLRQHEPGLGGVGAEGVQGLRPLAAVMAAPRGLSVDGDELGPIRPHRCNPALEAALEQARIHPIEQNTQPALAGDAVMKRRKSAEEIQMMLAPRRDNVEIVAGRDRGADHQQQDFPQRISHPPRLALVLDFRKVLQQQGQTVPRHLLVQYRIDNDKHRALPKRISLSTESRSSCQLKIALQPSLT